MWALLLPFIVCITNGTSTFFFKFAKQTGNITENILSGSYNVRVCARRVGHTKQTLPVVLTSCCHIVFSTLKSKTWVAQLAEWQRQEDGSSPFPTTLLRCWLASQTPWKVNSSLLFCCKHTPTHDFSTKRNSSYLVLMFSKFPKSQTKNHVFMQANQPQTQQTMGGPWWRGPAFHLAWVLAGCPHHPIQ